MPFIRDLRDWMRVVLARGEILLLAILILLILEAFHLWGYLQNFRIDQTLDGYRIVLLSSFAFTFGVYRAFGFHPMIDDAYFNWLKLSPWQPGRPLPAGPVQLQLQDVVVVLTLMALNWRFSWLNFVMPGMFLLGYLASNVVLNWSTGEWALEALVAFGLASLPLLHAHLEYVLPVELVCLLLAYWATHRSFKRFPWAATSASFDGLLTKPIKDVMQLQVLGWPYDLLAPKPAKYWIKAHDGICISLLLGWAEFSLFTMISQLPNPPAGPFVLFGVFPGFVGALCALGAATNSYSSPIDIWGRLCTFRWIIPKHDVLAATYLVAGLVSILMHATFQIWLGSIGTALAFLILTVLSPSVETWRLTAPHRLKFVRNSQEFVQLQ